MLTLGHMVSPKSISIIYMKINIVITTEYEQHGNTFLK